MYRNLIAVAFAAASLSAMATQASAGTFDELKKSYTLRCAANQTDGVSLKSGMMIITNTSPHTIRKGTRIDIVVAIRAYRGYVYVKQSEVAFRDVNARDTIAFAPQRLRVVSCTATAAFLPHVKAKVVLKPEKIGSR